jgi:hypothetical protein
MNMVGTRGPVMSSCERANELLGYKKRSIFLDWAQ